MTDKSPEKSTPSPRLRCTASAETNVSTAMTFPPIQRIAVTMLLLALHSLIKLVSLLMFYHRNYKSTVVLSHFSRFAARASLAQHQRCTKFFG